MRDLSPTERREDILRTIQIRRIVTAEELADDYGVSKTTIYRDMRFLASVYDGIVPLRGHEGGYLCDYHSMPRQHILPMKFEDGLLNMLPVFNGEMREMALQLIDQYGSMAGRKRAENILKKTNPGR